MFDENCFFSSGAPATRQSGARDPGPQWAGGLQPRARAAHPPTAPRGQGGPDSAPEQSLHPLPPVGRGLRLRVRAAPVPPAPGWQGGLEQRARAARVPPDTFLESTYPEMQREHIPRVNENQS